MVSAVELPTDGSSISFAILLGIVVLLALYLLTRPKKGKKLPGPFLPPSRPVNAVDTVEMEQLIKKYGPIFGAKVFRLNMLFLCDVSTIKEALVGQADIFAGRIDAPLIQLTGKKSGIIFIDGPKWQEHRRFILSVLRSFGFGKNITERIIQEELEIVSEQFVKLQGAPTFPRMTLLRSAANVICLLVFGERCGDEPTFDLLVRVSNDVTSPVVRGLFVAIFFRLVLKLPGDYFGLKKYLADNDTIEQYLKDKINQHRQTIDWDNERDLIDAYLKEIKKRESEGSVGETGSFDDFQIIRVVLELFIAGMETTSTTVTWSLYLLAKYPEVQSRVQQEIDSVIGQKVPQFADRSKLVYTMAVLHEVERYATVSAFSVPHRVLQDTEVRGYSIAKNTMVMPYLLGAHRDPQIWKRPKEFDPSHFYDESTKSLINLQNLIPFSLGKRQCLGESLAAQELFVMFAGLVQRFRFEPDPNQPLPEVNEDQVIIPFRTAMDFKVIARERFTS